MTGLVAQRIKLEPNAFETSDGKDKIWQQLLDNKNSYSLMGCSAEGETEGFIDSPEGENTGILSGHAYSVIDVFPLNYNETEQGAISAGEKEPNYHKNHRLLRVRNPWGYGEWNLKWSEHEDYRERLESFSNLLDSYYDSEVQRIKA